MSLDILLWKYFFSRFYVLRNRKSYAIISTSLFFFSSYLYSTEWDHDHTAYSYHQIHNIPFSYYSRSKYSSPYLCNATTKMPIFTSTISFFVEPSAQSARLSTQQHHHQRNDPSPFIFQLDCHHHHNIPLVWNGPIAECPLFPIIFCKIRSIGIFTEPSCCFHYCTQYKAES